MSLINVVDLNFAYEGSSETIFEQVSFQIDTNWKLGFIGRNGRGKTTFLKLLMGQYEYRGTISASTEFEYFPYEVDNQERMTIEILEEIYPRLELWQMLRELNLIKVSEEALYRPFCTLSGGERTKMLLAVLFLKENHFLLIDEPTNHLDNEARELVANYLNKKNGYILVSHDRKFLDACVDHILSVNKMNIEVQKGNFSSWYANKQALDRMELAQNEKLKGEVKRLAKAAKQSESWSEKIEKTKKGTRVAGLRPDRGHIGHKAAKMMKRSKSLESRRTEALEEKSKLLKNIESADSLKLFPLAHHADRLVQIKELSVLYGERTVCRNLSLEIRQGERICLSGLNGCGKSSVLKLLLGEEISYTGVCDKASGLKISYVPQDTSGLYGDLKEIADQCKIEESLFKMMLRKLDLEHGQFDKNVSDYSDGQKKKVLLARSLCEQAHLYIWDEPFNYIDLLSRIQIEELLLSYGPTMIFVEHDETFRDKIATKVILL